MKDRDWAAVEVDHPSWLRGRQEALVRAADVVAGVSPALVADCRSIGIDAIHIANGCDVSAFQPPTVEPARLRRVPRPRVVFAGAWNERVDAALVGHLAASLPEVSILIIGAVSSPVPTQANVHVLGPVPYAELPAHLHAADVGIIPYRASTFNDASCPLKLYEYLAAGLPVVASAVDLAPPLCGSDVVRRCGGPDAFTVAVDSFIGHDRRATCVALAAASSWDRRADDLLRALDDVTGGRTRP